MLLAARSEELLSDLQKEIKDSGGFAKAYPIDLKKINNEFAHLSGEDLLIRTMHIVGRKKT